ncbi:aldolase/citrate lyase family protein, partial [Brevibacterium luteolum]|uniref:aldolase/citrate lyase family protein n=1 Tax=Brevibacterium luteolum TaxID=199591 RepID=UPI0021AE40E5
MTPPTITYLYTPASSTDKLARSLQRGADVVIFDLEDAVAPDQKVAARDGLGEFLGRLNGGETSRIHVRINALDTPWGEADLQALAKMPHVEGIRVPKVN